ncbi:MAG: aminotransferase class IV [bacterium]
MNAPYVHWQGAVVPAESARVSVFDAGFLYGDGVYETMRAYSGRVFARDAHLARLARSAAAVRLPIPDAAQVGRAIRETLHANELSAAIVRVTITRGRLARRLDLSSAGAPSVLVTTHPYDEALDEERRRGIRVVYSRFLRHSDFALAGVKSTNYQVSLLARDEARAAGAAEVLLANESGDIVEAAAANVFLVEGRRIATPPLRSGILGGVTRSVVLECAGAAGYEVAEETLARERLEAADEVFLTGTTIQVAPVTRLGDMVVGAGRPGPVARELLAAYERRVHEDVARTPGDAR